MIDWLNPTQDMIDAREAGRYDRQDEIDNLEAEIERLSAELAQGKYRQGVSCGYCSHGGAVLLEKIERLQIDKQTVIDLVDDVLYNPEPVFDEHGDRITGDAVYMLDRPIMEDNLPALRAWFVQQCEAANAAKGGEGE